MEDEEHMKAVMAGTTEVNLSPSAAEYFSNFAIEWGWDSEEYGLQMEYLPLQHWRRRVEARRSTAKQ